MYHWGVGDIFQPGSCHPDIHGGPGRVSQILTMFQFHPVVPIYLVSRDMTTTAIVWFVDPAVGSLEKKGFEFSKRVTVSCLALPSHKPHPHIVHLYLGEAAPQRFW